MIVERSILKILEKREEYNKYSSILDTSNISSITKDIVYSIKKYYKDNTTIDTIDWDSFSTWFVLTSLSGCSDKDPSVYQDIFNDLKAMVYPSSEDPIIRALLERSYAERVSNDALEVAYGKSKKKLSDVAKVLEEYESKTNALGEELVLSPAGVMDGYMSPSTKAKGFDWRLEELNVAIGPLSKGDLVLAYARPEVGKTTFAMSELTHMVEQLPDDPSSCILFFNNEEKHEAIAERFIQAALNVDHTEVTSNPIHVATSYDSWVGKRRVGIISDPSLTTRMAESILSRFKPSIIVFNVMDKVRGFGEAESDPERLRRLFQWARGVAYKYGPVLALAQADATASGVRFLNMDQVYGSKTGIQGECDAMIGIGKSADPAEANLRFLSVPKNKLPGGPRSDPALRHGSFVVGIDSLKARFWSKTK